MNYIIAPASMPAKYMICGKLMTEGNFVHPNRTLDAFVLIYVLEGVLHIAQDDTQHDVAPGQTILLLPNHNHYGYRSSEGCLSYYWVHFSFHEDKYYIQNTNIKEYVLNRDMNANATTEEYVLPEIGTIPINKRVEILFGQMLDISKQMNTNFRNYSNYALSSLLLEITSQYISYYVGDTNKYPPNIIRIRDWVKAKYVYPITVSSIADNFSYNPRYLSTMFKKYCGITLIDYINHLRIEHSKELLIEGNKSVKEIAWSSGFENEKYYMRLFKMKEGITPTEYRNAFIEKKINSEKIS